jgi:hypothetical protein
MRPTVLLLVALLGRVLQAHAADDIDMATVRKLAEEPVKDILRDSPVHELARGSYCEYGRARFDPTDLGPCGRIDGQVKTRSGRKIAFTATRIPECGNEIREPGEQCDGADGALFFLNCCTGDCRVNPDCPVVCDFRRGFRCEGADEVCVTACGFSGTCRPRADLRCEPGPVCDCSGEVTYSSNCAAYDAGAGVSHKGACTPPN